jgi:uncharacterized YigZ family protein
MIDFDAYDTISTAEQRASIKVQRSEFIGVAFPIDGEAAFSGQLARIQKEFHDATHHCWAWRWIDRAVLREQSSDAGEPSGTAGRPILQAIESAKLIDVGVVVVRYYGGVKLGTGGLGRAYRDAAREVLDGVPRVTRYLYGRVVVEVGYAGLSGVYRLLAPPDVVLVSETFGEPNRFELDVRRSRLDALVRELEEKRIAVVRE